MTPLPQELKTLPQELKTQLAVLAVYGDKLTLEELANRLRILAKAIDDHEVRIKSCVDSQL